MRKISILLSAIVLTLCLSACHKMPEHAKYIPKDATTVLSVDVMAMGKKMAWNAITGSKIFDEWKARPEQKDAVKDLDKSGIDYLNTMYLYTQKDDRFEAGQKIVLLFPLSDAAEFDGFVKKNFPNVGVENLGKRKEALLMDNFYAGWDKDLLIVIYARPPYVVDYENGIGAAKAVPLSRATLSAEIAKCFSVSKDNMLVTNKHFADLQNDGHDISLWVNNELMMSDYMSKPGATGLSFSNSLWKDAAFTAGFDFNKGAIKSDMKYYTPTAIADILREMGSRNADKGMVAKLPASDLDMVAAMYLSPKAIKAMMEKTGVLGLTNIALSGQGLSADDILDAFTGDIGFAMNNFNVAIVNTTSDSSSADYTAHTDYTTKADYVYVMGINKKENFNKILQLATTSEVLRSAGNNVYTLKNEVSGGPVLVVGDKYAVISNSAANGQAYLSSGGNKLPAAAEGVMGHPLGFYMDVKAMTRNIDPAVSGSGPDSAIVSEAKKLIDNLSMSGGEFKNNTIRWSMTLNFTDKEENSLIQILNFAIHVGDAQNKGLTASSAKIY